MAKPGRLHWEAAKHVMRYLKGTINFKLKLSGQDMVITGWCDADWGNNEDHRRSVTGYVFKLGNSLITWNSQQQKTVAKSTMEAEYMSASSATSEAMYLRQLMAELGYPQSCVVLHSDNSACVAVASNPGHHRKSKHIDIHHHYCREQVAAGTIKMVQVASEDQLADVLTKPLSGKLHYNLIHQLGVCEY
jgi:hypothetical protein